MENKTVNNKSMRNTKVPGNSEPTTLVNKATNIAAEAEPNIKDTPDMNTEPLIRGPNSTEPETTPEITPKTTPNTMPDIAPDPTRSNPASLNPTGLNSGEPKRLIDAINELRGEVTKLNQQRFFAAHNTWKSLIIFNLVRGLMFGLGSAIGATLLVYLFIHLLAQIDFIPIIGDWVHQIIGIIESR